MDGFNLVFCMHTYPDKMKSWKANNHNSVIWKMGLFTCIMSVDWSQQVFPERSFCNSSMFPTIPKCCLCPEYAYWGIEESRFCPISLSFLEISYISETSGFSSTKQYFLFSCSDLTVVALLLILIIWVNF